MELHSKANKILFLETFRSPIVSLASSSWTTWHSINYLRRTSSTWPNELPSRQHDRVCFLSQPKLRVGPQHFSMARFNEKT